MSIRMDSCLSALFAVSAAASHNEAHHPTSDPELGGGGHPVPKLIINAHGWLEGGRTFSLHLTWVDGQVQSSLIAFN